MDHPLCAPCGIRLRTLFHHIFANGIGFSKRLAFSCFCLVFQHSSGDALQRRIQVDSDRHHPIMTGNIIHVPVYNPTLSMANLVTFFTYNLVFASDEKLTVLIP